MPDLPSCSLAKNCLSARKLHHWAEHPWDPAGSIRTSEAGPTSTAIKQGPLHCLPYFSSGDVNPHGCGSSPTTQGLLANEVTKPHPAHKEQRPCDLSLARPRAGARRAGTPWGGRDGRPGAEGCWSLPTAGRPQSEKPARQPPGWRPDSLALPAAAWPLQPGLRRAAPLSHTRLLHQRR